MLHLYMKQRTISMRDRIIIKDEVGNDLYLMVGKWGRFGDGLFIYDLQGNLLAEVRQLVFSIFPAFEVQINQKKVADITKFPSLNKPYFKVSKLRWLVTGDFLNHHYEVTKGPKKIMTLEKAYLSWGDLYALNIENEEDALMCLAIAAVVDNILITRKRDRKWPPVWLKV